MHVCQQQNKSDYVHVIWTFHTALWKQNLLVCEFNSLTNSLKNILVIKPRMELTKICNYSGKFSGPGEAMRPGRLQLLDSLCSVKNQVLHHAHLIQHATRVLSKAHNYTLCIYMQPCIYTIFAMHMHASEYLNDTHGYTQRARSRNSRQLSLDQLWESV